MADALTNNEILKMPAKNQMKILNLWFEAKRTSAEKMLLEAEPLLVLYMGLSELFNNALKNFSDFHRYRSVVKQGYITSNRYEELHRFYVDFNGQSLCATFIGPEHPANSNKKFFGIFESDAKAISEAKKIDITEEPFWL